MTKIKDKNGKSVEAFDLIMHRKVAMDILSGKQKIIYRQNSSVHFNNIFIKDMSTKEFFDYKHVHLHNVDNTWFLDVETDGVQIIPVCGASEGLLHSYGDHTIDFHIEKAKADNVQPTDADAYKYYILPVINIVNTNLK